MTTTNSDVIEKVRKLLALAANTGATEAEAETAMSMASALMARHGIEQSQVQGHAQSASARLDHHLAMKSDTFHLWHYHCVAAAAALYACRPYFVKESAEIFAVGTTINGEAVRLMTPYLVACVERAYKDNLPKGLSQSARAEYRRTFKFACANRLHTRARMLVAEMSSNDQAASSTGSRALVVASYFKEELTRISSWMQSEGFALKTSKRPVRGGSGTLAGLKAGDAINLNRQVGGASTRQLN